ncbi:hypothetical protein B0H17DRAFT_1133336 [Mycena rosella]|uniref:Uncharacterized protein n=1 Tax=Mycena rosella TaxID=1033263 RepID=A0AAD7DHS5_MYCRO|nr:hypothetical protein B0H17DRAFT_1133336 [Mycena rosella]
MYSPLPDDKVQKMYSRMLANTPVKPRNFVSILFLPAAGIAVHWVHVPMLGAHVSQRALEDAAYDYWLSDFESAIRQYKVFRIDRFPADDPELLTHSYSVVAWDQAAPGLERNGHVREIIGDTDEHWRGGVLVFSHVRNTDELGNINAKEYKFITCILGKVLKDELAGMAVRPELFPTTIVVRLATLKDEALGEVPGEIHTDRSSHAFLDVGDVSVGGRGKHLISPESQLLSDFKIGPEWTEQQGQVVNNYVAVDGQDMQVLVIGVVAEVVDIAPGLKVVVLVAPAVSAPIVRDMFADGTKVLETVMLRERTEMIRKIMSTQAWSHGLGVDGAVYVRVCAQTIEVTRRGDTSGNGGPGAWAGWLGHV